MARYSVKQIPSKCPGNDNWVYWCRPQKQMDFEWFFTLYFILNRWIFEISIVFSTTMASFVPKQQDSEGVQSLWIFNQSFIKMRENKFWYVSTYIQSHDSSSENFYQLGDLGGYKKTLYPAFGFEGKVSEAYGHCRRVMSWLAVYGGNFSG